MKVVHVVGALIIAIAVIAAVYGMWNYFETAPTGTTSAPQTLSVNDCRNFGEARVTAGDKELTVAIADSDEERAHGLSGCERIPEAAGMYFSFAEPKSTAFWMKDMKVPLDIIWISKGKVVAIDHEVPPSAAGTPEKELIQYSSPGPIDAVLELAATKAQEYGIKSNTEVTLVSP